MWLEFSSRTGDVGRSTRRATLLCVKATRLIISLALLFAACGASTEEAVVSQASPGVSIDQKLNGEFSTVSGESIDLASYRNSDLVVWFWAPW